ncbi:hypothetical protein EVAR_33241_1 [Eumeta japonica]|uniref:Uncharacterized protein n=1 Tax=Eumeta variegata TaxID=151549 RepID=A0A4C1X0L1_EUMVA|nr:hypothetical protein EVAR_33241_1 [Eumeta japonica]
MVAKIAPDKQEDRVPEKGCMTIGCVRPLLFFYSDVGRWSGRQIARPALSPARSAQTERDNESCFLGVQPAFIDL